MEPSAASPKKTTLSALLRSVSQSSGWFIGHDKKATDIFGLPKSANRDCLHSMGLPHLGVET